MPKTRNTDNVTKPEPSLTPGQLLTDRGVASILKVSRAHVWALAKQGKFKALKLSERTTRFSSDSVIAFINQAAA